MASLLSMLGAYNLAKMGNDRIVNVVGALALALSDSVLQGAETQAPEPGQAAAAIALLRHAPGMAIEQLRRALKMSHPGTVRLVDRLVAGGLVERRPSEQDRRAVALHLTEAGDRKCAAILRARGERVQRSLGALDEFELNALGQIAEKLLAALVHNLDEAYTVCRLCDVDVCADCPVERGLADHG
ncbi:MarR family winged helix-turn-helix transcriptional regulator [Hansschlegelia sp. KR7-227]|uniref:MarR family winged helix-turn-helix transcriptional regulator n=1 Tax=Hansschlegelia sp. KR7-227 TaxID=3400914 RepID=UPI003C0FAFBD